ncbi:MULTISPECIES: hypothetical protein [unclassified Beijerinckia]|uniref:hypothetical protein n=1 Tax=unclassified Beijerinckia TaxID=2638183 RepID=UPI00089700DB|nr:MULTISPECIES: hypothetical protein [unclassified Beijerinckia]MDH7797406.1 uncharacterized protein with HEPN domain [Beijerinckia sp. GAS462]SEC84228.1 hypothetical protein SAMN05443249_3700 [Beijerinckia sp. 28-YEA-48]
MSTQIQESLQETPAETPLRKVKDARDLLTHLYREIGISAVAAALHIRADKQEALRPGGPRPQVKDIPAFLRGDDRAA